MKSEGGYSLIEMVIAGAILAMGIFAAAALANSLVQQQEWSPRIKAMLNTQEQAGRLFHLGLNATQITNILPVACSAKNAPPADGLFLSFSNSTTNLGSVGNMTRSVCLAVFAAQRRISGGLAYRSNSILLVRPSIQ